MLRGHQTEPAAVPASWRGPLPDLSVQRHLNTGGGYAQVPLELVFSDISDLGVMTWALIKLSFEDRAEVATYRQFADELGLGHLQDNAVKRRFLAAVPALIDAGWLKRSRAADNQVRYQAVVPEGSGRRYAKIRRRDIALLTAPPRGREQRRVTVAHLADFARWQLECGSRGWTAETADGLAQHWGVSPRTLRQRRDSIRSTKDVPGLIMVEERPGHADLVWLGELYGSAPDPVPVSAGRSSRLLPDRDRRDAVVRGHDERTARPLLTLQGGWRARRISAVRRLHSGLTQLAVNDAWWRPHEVYLIHFPDEHRYKVGLTLVGSQRIKHLTTNGASVVVDRVVVSNRFVAEMIEVDVLIAIEPWHQFGDPLRKESGYTEMWSDGGPSIDLASFTAAATSEVARLLTQPETPT